MGDAGDTHSAVDLHDDADAAFREVACRVDTIGRELFHGANHTAHGFSASIAIKSRSTNADCHTLERRFRDLVAPDFDVSCVRRDDGVYVFTVRSPMKTTV